MHPTEDPMEPIWRVPGTAKTQNSGWYTHAPAAPTYTHTENERARTVTQAPFVMAGTNTKVVALHRDPHPTSTASFTRATLREQLSNVLLRDTPWGVISSHTLTPSHTLPHPHAPRWCEGVGLCWETRRGPSMVRDPGCPIMRCTSCLWSVGV